MIYGFRENWFARIRWYMVFIELKCVKSNIMCIWFSWKLTCGKSHVIWPLKNWLAANQTNIIWFSWKLTYDYLNGKWMFLEIPEYFLCSWLVLNSSDCFWLFPVNYHCFWLLPDTFGCSCLVLNVLNVIGYFQTLHLVNVSA